MSKFVVNLLVAGAALLAMLLTGCSDSDAPTATPSVSPCLSYLAMSATRTVLWRAAMRGL